MKTTTGVDFRPFQAWRYHPERVKLEDVIAPPYDVISADEQEALYARSPFNVVRLILGKESDFYRHAQKCWRDWAQQGILVQDERPCFYLYEQVFTHPWNARRLSRLAVVGIFKLDSSDWILSHEETFAAPKRDRLLLLENTQTNLSAVFGLYRDRERVLQGLFSSYRDKSNLFSVSDDRKVLHRGWAIEREEDQRTIREALSRQKILIADGHHRFETALEYQRRMRERLPKDAAEGPFDFVMMALVASEDEGLSVLPTHRVIRSFGDRPKREILDRLRTHFDFLSVQQKELFSELNRRSPDETVLGGIFRNEGSFLLRLRNQETVQKLIPSAHPPIWYRIEANLLEHFIFGILWGVSTPKRQECVSYTSSWEEAAQRVGEGKAEAAFFLRSPGVDTIRKLADTGERMPQKTTYFYPKLASGLFFYHHG